MVEPSADATGMSFGPDGILVRRALAMLEDGPRAPQELAERVLGIRGGPPAVTSRLVSALLAGEARAERGRDGRWRVASQDEATDDAPARRLADLHYAVVDVETTGTVAGRGGRIIEIAIVHVERGEIVDVFATLVDAGVAISPWISRLTGIRTEMTRGAPRFREIVGEVRRRLGGRVFVAHNAGFDWGFVRAEMGRAGAAPPRGPRLCTVHFARRLLPGLPRRGLDAVARYYGIEIHERHRARGDALATARILGRMLSDAERRGWTTWADLRRALSEPPPGRKKVRKEGGPRADR